MPKRASAAAAQKEAMVSEARYWGRFGERPTFDISAELLYSRHPPHFHAIYDGCEGAFSIDTLEMLAGDLPVKAQSLVREWAAQYKSELKEMWNTKKLQKLQPLE